MKTVLITGTSKGIGSALAAQFLRNGYKVFGASRTNHSDGFESFALDLSNPESITEFGKTVSEKGINIDILINNAGMGPDLGYAIPEVETFRQTFDVNVIGAVFATEALLPLVNDGGKIVNISSKMGSIELCGSSDAVAYRMSKTALNMYTKILSNRLKGKQTVASVHPGWVRTEIAKGNEHAPFSTEESAERIFGFISGNFKTGTFWSAETLSECDW